MSDKIKNRVIGGLLSVLLLGGAERAFHTYQWAGQVNREAKAAIQYLAQPVAVDKSGKSITRAEVLDAFIEQAKRNSQSQGRPSTPGDPR
jgi:hypothetical protein